MIGACRGQDQARIGRGVSGLEAANGVEVAAVCNQRAQLAELFQCVHKIRNWVPCPPEHRHNALMIDSSPHS